MQGNFDYVIGSGGDADIRLEHPGIAAHHAVFRRRSDRLFIKPLSAESETYLNGRLAPPGRFSEFTRFDRVRLATLPIELSSNLFMGRRRLGLRTTPLYLIGTGGRMLCNGIQVEANPGTLTAIMGPSGCGKSVLLKLLAGIFTPQDGRVFLANLVDATVFEPAQFPNTIGFVPQGDALHPELATGVSLGFRLKLLFPDMVADVRARLIRQLVQRIGFTGRRQTEFLSTPIGSADASGAVLSGGERRRANLCHELLAQPLVLLLDEVTSGLSSKDADDIVDLLKNLAVELGLTILTTIHQPSERAFARFDQLLLLSYGGVLAYRGPTRDACERIAQHTGLARRDGVAATEFVAEAHHALAAKPLADPCPPLPQVTKAPFAIPLATRSARRNLAAAARRAVMQPVHLLLRQLYLIFKDRYSLAFAFAQVPILFLLVYVTFAGSGSEYAEADSLLRTQHHFQHLVREAGGYRIGLLEQAHAAAAADASLISEAHARHKAALVYILTLIAIWFGLMASCCDLVNRRQIIERECRSGISLAGSIGALFAGNALLALTQSLLVAALALHYLPEVLIARPGSLLWAVSAATLVAVALGLLISAAGATARAALTLVPVCLIPQILLGGLFRPLSGDAPLYALLASLNPQRWAFDLALRKARFSEAGVLTAREGALVERDDLGPVTTLQELIQFRAVCVRDLYFPEPHGVLALSPVTALCAIGAAFLALAYLASRLRMRG